MSGSGQKFSRRLRHKGFGYIVAGLLSTVPLLFGSATAWAEESIVLDLVRHGQSVDNAAGVLDTSPPGAELTALGQAQAHAIAEALAPQGPYAGIYASELVRAEETAAPLAEALHNVPVQILPGLNEINAGIFEGQQVDSLGGLLYLLAPMAWVLGAEFVPIPGSTTPNGIAFDESFGNAVQTIYDNTVSAGGSNPTDVAFSSEGAMTAWTLMNVNNPDFSLIFNELLKTGQFLPNGGEIVVQGDPQDGWTMVSFDGQPVPQDLGLPTELFVDVRNLIEAPQFAAYNIYEALLSSDPTTITNAIDAGVNEVGTATAQFPVAVIDDITNALGGGTANALADVGGLSSLGDLYSVLPTLATDLSGMLPGELGGIIGALLASF